MINEGSNQWKWVRVCSLMLLFILQTPPPNLFFIRLEIVGFSLNACTPALQNKTNEGISK